MVAARALAPDGKLAMEDWVALDVVLPGVIRVEVHDVCQVMDLVLDAEADLKNRVSGAVADVLSLQVGLWKLGRVITVIDRGFTSAENLRTLQ